MQYWLSCTQPNSKATARLFCFPYAGGGAWIYRTWGQSLQSLIEVHSIELPGHGQRLIEEPVTQLESLIASLAKAMEPYLDKPFAFFGHSLGGLIAFELIKFLHQSVRVYPFHLWVSATRAPHLPHPRAPIHMLPDGDLIREVQRYNGTATEILNSAEFMQLLLPALRADFTILETYSYKEHPPLPCPITAFFGENDTITSEREVAAWKKHTSQKFSLQKFSGDHFFIHRPETLSAVKSHFVTT